jgi:TonB family protein
MQEDSRFLRRIAIGAILVLLAGRSWGQVPKIMGQQRPGTVQDWDQRIKTAEERLRAGDFKKAQSIAEGLVWEMVHTIESGPGAGPILGETLLLRALGFAGRGKMREALWDWSAACVMNPKLTNADLVAYGPAGEALLKESEQQGIPKTSDGKPRAASAPKVEGEVSRPVQTKGESPNYPKALHTLCAQGTVVLEGVVDEKGYVVAPALVSSTSPIFTLATLEALRTWRFKPAVYQGKPVAVYYTLTQDFEIPRCLNPAAVAVQGKKKG